MNDIYWQERRAMSAKQISTLPPPPPTQPRRVYENSYHSRLYTPSDIRLSGQPTSTRLVTSAYDQYPKITDHRSHPSSAHFPYSSSLHGVYRPSPPAVIATSSRLHSHERRQLDLRPENPRSQMRPLSRSASEDYYTNKYHDSNGFNHDMFSDENEFDNEENSSDDFHYTYNERGVSFFPVF